jgi:flagellar assembly protein FliH
MSARILSDDDALEGAPPVLWRVAGTPAAAPSSVTGGSQTGHRQDPRPSQAQRQDVDPEAEQRISQAAYQNGYSAGVNAGLQQATERMQPVLLNFSNMIQELTRFKKQFRHEAEASTVGLALAIARRVLYREIAADPEAILGLVRAAFDKCTARETQRLRVSPPDRAAIQENLARIGLPPELEIVADAKLPRGSAIFETTRGDLDASVDTQLLEIERGFTDILRRRAG